MHQPELQPPGQPAHPAPPPGAVPQYLYPRAGAGKRFLNHIIDTVAATAVVIGYTIAAVFATRFIPRAEGFADSTANAILFYSVYIGYFFVMELTTGRTLGKLITNTRVVNLADTNASWLQILGRTASRFIPFEPLSFLGATASGWHDSLSKTKVIDTSRPPNVVMPATASPRPFDPAAGQPARKA